jgi:murein DD-endopeptidase MepM/ murein hydrolase activator NlpD
VDYGQTHHDYPATDMFAPCGSDMVAITDGVVQELSRVDHWDPATDLPDVRGGLFISLVGDDGVRYYTAHLHDILPNIRPGLHVRGGQLLAHVGQTGNAVGLGCHVHLGISPPCGPGEWSIRRGTFYPWPYLDSWRNGGQKSPVAAAKDWRAQHRSECAAHRLAGT